MSECDGQFCRFHWAHIFFFANMPKHTVKAIPMQPRKRAEPHIVPKRKEEPVKKFTLTRVKKNAGKRKKETRLQDEQSTS